MTSTAPPSGYATVHRRVSGSAHPAAAWKGLPKRLLVPALLVWLLFGPLGLSGQEVRPYSIDHVLELLLGEVLEPRILRMVGVQCIDFDLDPQTVRRFRAAGATTGFLGELALVCRVGEGRITTRQTPPPAPVVVAAPTTRPTPPQPAPSPRQPLPTGRFGHLGFSAVVAAEDPETIPVGAELAIGFGNPLVGLRGAVLAVGVMEQGPEPTRRGQNEGELRILPSAGVDLVLLPGSTVYALAGGSFTGLGEIAPRFGIGIRIPSNDPDGYVLEVRAQQGHPRFWGEGGTWTEGMVLTVSFGLGGRGFREGR